MYIIVANGELPSAGVESCVALLAQATVVIAADGGLTHCVRLGCQADVVVGDLDSAPTDLVQTAVRQGAIIREYPTDKDASDLELALDYAVADGATEVAVIAPFGGRLDHELATVGLLAAAATEQLSVYATDGRRQLWVVGQHCPLRLATGETVSLLPWGGPAVGVTTTDLQWSLDDATLELGTTWGLSNVVAGGQPSVGCRSGVLLAVSDRMELTGS